MRRGIVQVTGCAVLLAAGTACSGDDGDTGSGGTADALSARAGLSAATVVEAICDGWATGYHDSMAVNQYVNDLLLPLDLVNSADRPAYRQEDIDAAVVDACAELVSEPDAFVDAVLDDLGLTSADLDARVAAACSRYERQRGRIEQGEVNEEDLSDLIRQIADERGTPLAELRKALSDLCG